MALQIQILSWFSSIHCSFLDAVAKFFTLFGEEYLEIAILVFIFWCIDKKKGFASCFTLLCAAQIMSLLKAIVRFPRPWKVAPQLDSQRVQTATGYSFPSGHTTNSSSTYASIALSFRKRALSIVCGILILFVGISRMYLCVHWPMDVACGYIIGIGTALIGYRYFILLFEKTDIHKKILIVLGVLGSAAAALIGVLLCFEKIDYDAFSDYSKMLAMLGGLSFGFVIEHYTTCYSVEEGSWGRKIARYLLGMVAVLLILPLGKSLLVALNIYNPFTAQVRYFLVALWCCVWPCIGKKIGLFK